MDTQQRSTQQEQPPDDQAAEPGPPPLWRTRRFRVMLVLVSIAVLLGLTVRNYLPQGVARWYASAAQQHLFEGQPDDALADCDRAIRWQPEAPGLYLLRARINVERQDLQAALADCNKVRQLNPNYPQILHRRSTIYQLLGDHDKAIADAQEAVRWWGDEIAEALNHLAYHRAVADRDLEAALEDVNKALKLVRPKKKAPAKEGEEPPADPKDDSYASYLDTRGFIYYRQGKYKEALADFDEAIAVVQRVRKAQADKLSALPDAQRKWTQKSSDAHFGVMHHHRGLVYEKLGEADKAQADKAKAQELGYDPKKHGI